MIAKGRTCHGGPQPDALRALANRAKSNPGEARMSLVGLPGLKVIARGNDIEPRLFGQDAELDQLGHRELLLRELKTDAPRLNGAPRVAFVAQIRNELVTHAVTIGLASRRAE